MTYPATVRIVEVGPRDGLQNESARPSTTQKIRFIEQLADAGLATIEVGSFVSPRSVPAMADSAEVFQGLRRKAGVSYSALVPNLRGLQAAVAAGVSEIAVFASASEAFSSRNINCSIAQSLDGYRQVVAQALENGLRVRGYVSCIAGCPYEGSVATASVLHVALELLNLGCYEISLGDTIGVGTRRQIEGLLREVTEHIAADKLAVHFHDTGGQALDNIEASLECGICVVDSSAGGLGGCPYAPGAPGNVATEDVVRMLDGLGIATGVNVERVMEASREMRAALGRG